jgi:hypothetical protein
MSDPTTTKAQLIHRKEIERPNIFITEGKRRAGCIVFATSVTRG